MYKASWKQQCVICREPINKRDGFRRTDAGNAHDRCALARPVNAERRAAYGKRQAQQRRRAKAARG